MARRTPTTAPRFRAAHAEADDWRRAAQACLAGLGRPAASDDLGLVYVTEDFAGETRDIVGFLREATGIATWVGAAGGGICASGWECHSGGGMAVMVGGVGAGAVRPFALSQAAPEAFLAEHGDWVRRARPPFALVHADPRETELPGLLASLTTATGVFLVGGLTGIGEGLTHFAGPLHPAGLSGALFGEEVSVLAGLTQGCAPIGRLRTVSEAAGNVLLAIDGKPAFQALAEDAGLAGGDARRLAGQIHVGLPIPGSDTGDYTVRSLVAIDPERGWLAVGAELDPGDHLLFVRRDPVSARGDLERMLRSTAARLPPGGIRGGLYISCVARGAHMFGESGREAAMIRAALGDFPMVGFYANGEICHDRLYAYTGVLALFV